MNNSGERDINTQSELDRFCIDHAGVGIYRISDESGQILSVNRQACLDLGYSEAELLNMSIFDLDPNFSDPGKQKWRLHRKRVREKGTGTIETSHRRKDGSLMPVEVTVTYLEYQGQQISFSFAKNISKRKQFEEALGESEELFRTTLYSIGDAVITCSRDHKIRQLNKVAENLTGWTEAEAHSRPIEQVFRIINEKTRKPVPNPVEKVLKQGRIIGLANHTLLISKDHREIPIADSGAPIFSDGGEIIGAVLVFRDASKERFYQQQLENDHKFLTSFLNNLPGMAFRCNNNLNWDMDYVSQGCLNLTGYTPEELASGKCISFGDLIHPDDRTNVWDSVQKAIAEQAPYEIEYRITTKEKKEKWVWEKGESFLFPDSETIIIEGFINDVTGYKELEKKLKENDRLKTAFLQNVSHEIRTPLNAILGFSELIKNPDIEPAERKEYINIIESGGHKLLGILNNVLELSRIETGDITINRSIIPAYDFLKNLHSFFEPLAEAKGLKLMIDNSPKEQLVINTDSTRLDQIFNNLINNAIKYTDEGVVNIGFKPVDESILFYVKDTGPGISKKQQGKVFDRFYRSDDPRMLHHDGVGLGLAICLGLINALEGEIWLESEEDQGTSFFFSLPRS
ncbi:sensor histidine kinase [Marinilabilia rubra]|uniref:histidine kinase n=1 Tax=Marinilabilia rubra TaxID=2162893 RepID=A0A2U2BB63_9BACT|nr:PAS domain-containing sensor histidine kinase [Marinilabilia rubra]PWE00298.1 PAS domain-containing sensor histidine kinase [Marinilabilia rubra]